MYFVEKSGKIKRLFWYLVRLFKCKQRKNPTYNILLNSWRDLTRMTPSLIACSWLKFSLTIFPARAAVWSGVRPFRLTVFHRFESRSRKSRRIATSPSLKKTMVLNRLSLPVWPKRLKKAKVNFIKKLAQRKRFSYWGKLHYFRWFTRILG
jgi:hypothetical protein